MRTALIFLAAVAVIGCGDGPALTVKKVPFSLPAGFTEGASDDKVVQLAIPSGWRQGVDRLSGSMGMGDLSGLAGGTMPSDPDAAKAIQQMSADIDKAESEGEKKELAKLKEKGIIIHCITVGARPTIGETRTRFVVHKETKGSNWNWDDAHQLEAGAYLHKPVAKEVDLPIGKAHRMEETKTLVDGGVYTIISYVIPNGKDLYSLRFITQESASVIQQIEKQVADSIRIN